MTRAGILSLLGRLLTEISWEGKNVDRYRQGGRGYENVLTTEALQGLDFLPRSHFLGAVVENLQGNAGEAMTLLKSQVEEAQFSLLSGDMYLKPSERSHQTKVSVQPDGIITTSGMYVLLEAKRIHKGEFQPEQLAREFVLVTREAQNRYPLLLLILGQAPPVKVRQHGRFTIQEAIRLYLPAVFGEVEDHPYTLSELDEKIEDTISWITWDTVAEVVERQANTFSVASPSVQACIERLAQAVIGCIQWHSQEAGIT